MSVHAPRYSLPPPVLGPRSARVRAIVRAMFLERLGVLNVVLLALIFTVVLLEIIVPFYFSTLLPGLTSSPTLATFALPFQVDVWFFFGVLITASVGAGIVANDVATRAMTMYLARPITSLDYLTAKVSAVALWLTLAMIVPGIVGTIIVLALGYVSLLLAVQASLAFLGVGVLTVAVFTAVAVAFSAFSPRSSYAGAGVFGVLIGAEVVSVAVSSISGSTTVLYASPEQDLLAVAQYAFGVTGGSIDPRSAAAVLLAIVVVVAVLAYRRIASIQVVEG